MNTLQREFFKYFVAGTLAFLSDFTVFLSLTRGVGVHYLAANAVSFCFGLTVSYLCCIRWVFAHRTYGKVMVEFPVFLTISLVTLLIGELILLALVESLALAPEIAKVVMTGIIFIGNFLLKKFLLFNRKTSQ